MQREHHPWWLARAAALCLPIAAHAAGGGVPDWVAAPTPLLPMRLPVAASADWQIRGSASDFEALDAAPVRNLSGSWDDYSPRGGRNVALQSAQADLTATRERWEIATLVRGEALVSGPRSSWDAVRVYKQKSDPENGSRFFVDARYDTVILTGARLARSWALPAAPVGPVELTAAVSVLSVRRLQRIELVGAIDYSTTAGYGFAADGQRQDSGRQYGGYGDPGTTGRGYSIDVGLLWQPTAATFVNVSAMDLVSRLSVDGVSTQRATFSSTTRSYDSDGYLNYQPLVSGRYSSENVRSRMPRKASLVAGSRLFEGDDVTLAGVRWERYGTVDMPAAWAVLPAPAGLRLRLDHELRFKSTGIGLMTNFASLSVRTRSLPVGRTRALGWEASIDVPL